MKSKIILIILCAVLAVGLTASVTASAESNQVRDVFKGIRDYHFQQGEVSDSQQWLDRILCKKAGTNEWYVMGLSQVEALDYSVYEQALTEYLKNTQVYSATSRQKYAMALLAVGSEHAYIEETVNDSIGKQGVMSWVWGLHLMNNGCQPRDYTLEDVKEKLLSLQLADGGWALTGTVGDVDVTAMTLQALAPHYRTDQGVQKAVDRALTLLSQLQRPEGDYLSYGVPNPESGAQVLIALSALGIDYTKDQRFIKDGHTLLDGISRYRLSDGSFCHQEGKGFNANATVQVFNAMVSYVRLQEGKGSLYLLDGVRQANQSTPKPTKRPTVTPTVAPTAMPSEDITAAVTATPTATSAVTAAPTSTPAPQTEENHSAGVGYKLWVSLGIVLAAGIACGVLLLKKKRKLSNYLVIAVLALAGIAFVLMTNFQTKDDYYHQASKKDAIGKVTITIRCDTVVGKKASEFIPDDGVILAETEREIAVGDTAYTILQEVTAQHKIHMETAGNPVYIQGLNHLYEFEFGDLAGWLYRVNGEIPSVSCGEYTLSNGDRIEFLYSLEMGNDLK